MLRERDDYSVIMLREQAERCKEICHYRSENLNHIPFTDLALICLFLFYKSCGMIVKLNNVRNLFLHVFIRLSVWIKKDQYKPKFRLYLLR